MHEAVLSLVTKLKVLRRATIDTNKKKIKKAKKVHTEAFNLRQCGIDPGEAKKQARTERLLAPTVSDLIDEYIERHAKPKKRSWQTDHPSGRATGSRPSRSKKGAICRRVDSPTRI